MNEWFKKNWLAVVLIAIVVVAINMMGLKEGTENQKEALDLEITCREVAKEYATDHSESGIFMTEFEIVRSIYSEEEHSCMALFDLRTHMGGPNFIKEQRIIALPSGKIVEALTFDNGDGEYSNTELDLEYWERASPRFMELREKLFGIEAF